MYKIIVRATSYELRSLARNALKNSWLSVAVVCGFYYLMTTTVPSILSIFIPSGVYVEIYGVYLNISYVGYLYSTLMDGVFQLGLIIFILNFLRTRDTNATLIFSGFEFFVKAFCISFMTALFVTLWALLLIVPGIIAYIRYSQALYILFDDPRKGIFQCINESKEMMKGNKGKYFSMNLSFIGWLILGSLPSALFLLELSGIVMAFVDVILAIPYFFVAAYIETANGVFYEILSGHLVATEPMMGRNMNM